jgi:hypothetical protein
MQFKYSSKKHFSSTAANVPYNILFSDSSVPRGNYQH